MNKGTIYAVFAYLLWGFLPVFWKQLQKVPANEILCHRMVWSLVFALILLISRRRWKWLKLIRSKPRILITYFVTASMLAVNWFVYIWSVNHNYIVETSLGYFINPLIYVLLGFIILKERPRLWQWVAIGIATIGVLYLTLSYGTFPWIALTLACTFGLYGLLRKTSSLNALEGLSLETALLFLPALFFLLYLEGSSSGSFGHVEISTLVLLILTGVVTGVPLLLFAAAARRIPLTSIGILQYIAPTFQFLLGVFIYKEVLDKTRLLGFIIIWIALVIYTVESIKYIRIRNREKISI